MKDPLTHSDDGIAAVLERARRGLAPTDTKRRALLGRLPLTLDTPPPSPSSPEGTESALGKFLAGRVVSRFVTSGFVAGVAVGIGVGFGGGFWANSALRGDVASPVLSPVESAPSYPPVNEDASHVNAANTSVVVSSASEVGLVPPRPPRVGSKSDAGHTRARDVNTPKGQLVAKPPLFTNDDELAYVRRAQTALRHNNGALALALMRTLDEVLPRGALLAERNVTRVLALCQTGRVEEARVLARRVLRNDPTANVYAGRLAASCAHIDDPAQGE